MYHWLRDHGFCHQRKLGISSPLLRIRMLFDTFVSRKRWLPAYLSERSGRFLPRASRDHRWTSVASRTIVSSRFVFPLRLRCSWTNSTDHQDEYLEIVQSVGSQEYNRSASFSSVFVYVMPWTRRGLAVLGKPFHVPPKIYFVLFSLLFSMKLHLIRWRAKCARKCSRSSKAIDFIIKSISFLLVFFIPIVFMKLFC